VNFAFSEEQEELRATARRFLEQKVPSSVVRRLMDTNDGFDRALWQENAAMGWQAMAIPERYGGAGFGFVELVVLLQEMGRALYPSPFFSSAILGAYTILESADDERKEKLLPGIASGEHRVALAITEPAGRWDEPGIQLEALPDSGDWVLRGTKSFVIDGHTADTLIVAARTSLGPAGISLFIVPGEDVTRRQLDTMDTTRKQAEVVFDSLRVPGDALLGAEGDGWPILARVLDLASVALAAEAVGGAERCLEMSVEYAKTRVQFGRPIGSFQAIKHKCADMLLEVESAKSASAYAGWAAQEDPDELAVVAPLAKSYCTEAFFHCAAENIQIHGGIGFTWEHDAHLYFKRAKSSELLFGDPVYHREILAGRLGL
jgi:alkylation response protein AidB-like acyl-CoA dehydrogenase